MSTLNPVRFPADPLGFFAGCVKLAARARKRGQFGEDGAPIWSIEEWVAFCKGARAYSHLPMFGVAIVNTVHEIEEMIADGFDAKTIHTVLVHLDRDREAKNRQRDPSAIHYAGPQ